MPTKTFGQNKICEHICREGGVEYKASVSPIHDNNFSSDLFTGPKFGCIHHEPRKTFSLEMLNVGEPKAEKAVQSLRVKCSCGEVSDLHIVDLNKVMEAWCEWDWVKAFMREHECKP